MDIATSIITKHLCPTVESVITRSVRDGKKWFGEDQTDPARVKRVRYMNQSLTFETAIVNPLCYSKSFHLFALLILNLLMCFLSTIHRWDNKNQCAGERAHICCVCSVQKTSYFTAWSNCRPTPIPNRTLTHSHQLIGSMRQTIIIYGNRTAGTYWFVMRECSLKASPNQAELTLHSPVSQVSADRWMILCAFVLVAQMHWIPPYTTIKHHL